MKRQIKLMNFLSGPAGRSYVLRIMIYSKVVKPPSGGKEKEVRLTEVLEVNK